MGGSSVSPDLYREERYRVGKFTCDVCGNAWPMTHQKVEPGGDRVGVLCCFEASGDELTRDLRRAAASKYAAQLSKRELMPPRAPDGSVYAGSPEFIDDQPAIVSFLPSPIVVTVNGPQISVVFTGVNFASTDTFAITGNPGAGLVFTPTFVSATEWDAIAQALPGTQRGSYGLTFAGVGGDTQIWQGVFNVR